jgi:hypothetical protein
MVKNTGVDDEMARFSLSAKSLTMDAATNSTAFLTTETLAVRHCASESNSD